MSAEATDSRPILDHLVVLVSETTLKSLPESLTTAFTISPGGEHNSGETFNKLVLFEDGSYIELIAFYDRVSPESRRAHRWGSATENTIVDWAFTLPDESNFIHVQKRVLDANGGITYADPWDMGRTRPDGVELKWSIGAARQADGSAPPPGTVPFWCLDQTERKLRVPYHDNPDTKHPAGILGISEVLVSIPQTKFDDVKQVYAAISDAENHAKTDHSWEVAVPTIINYKSPTVSVKSTAGGLQLAVTLAGGPESPGTVEVLPGLTFNVRV